MEVLVNISISINKDTINNIISNSNNNNNNNNRQWRNPLPISSRIG